MTVSRTMLVGVCALVVGIYEYMAQSGAWESAGHSAADDYYNLLVQGFRAGQLSLKKEVPVGLTQLADPYDPAVNTPYQFAPYGMLDLSYYKGKLYLYWGVAPALILFWPFVALTGIYLLDSQAVTIFCAIGFLASVGLLCAVWRRYFAQVSVGVVAACALALGLATGLPVLLARSHVYEVPVSSGYMLTMLALGAIWCAIHEPERSCRWLAAASVAYGLVIASRPSLLFGAVILLLPVAQALRERRRVWTLWLAAVVPIALLGLGLMLYNSRRFDSPFEFGLRYQLAPFHPKQYFSLRYLWFNFRVYFLAPARWSGHFPFVHNIAAPPLPAGYGSLQTPFGVLTNVPLVWLALAVPWAWRRRSAQEASALRWFVAAVALLFGICAVTLILYLYASWRYEVDFLPALLLLAVVGILALERALADRPGWRRAARWGWGVTLVFSVVFNLLASVKYYAEGHYEVGSALLQQGRVQEAIDQYEQALRIMPDYGEPHNNLGIALLRLGRIDEGIEHFEQALQINPDYAEAHYNLGVALAQTGKTDEAIAHYERALRIKPDYAEAHNGLGAALLRTGNVQMAMAHYEAALGINPDYAEAHYNLGIALAQAGRLPEAMQQWEQVLRLKPDDVPAHYNLGNALQRQGRLPEAIEQFQQALKLRPDYTPAKNALARLQAGQ
jgi:tetratricopeptide (TPR) repeat protein